MMATLSASSAIPKALEAGPQQNGSSTAPVSKPDCMLESHYNDLLKVIEDIGRDVKPSYTNNKVSTDRLKKNIMMARSVLRDCMADLEKLASN